MRCTAPGPDGRTIELDDERLTPYRALVDASRPPVRRAYAAAHVVMLESYRASPHALDAPGSAEEIAEGVDWDATMRLRTRLDGLGFGIAEAMDTAQRFELGWLGAERLIRDCGALELEHGFIAGAGTDHLPDAGSIQELAEGLAYQVGVIQSAGGVAILLPQLWLASHATGADDYVAFYADVIARCGGPLIVHWLGEVFHPGLAGYFPGDSFRRVMALDPAKVRGCKLSLLDAAQERRVRAELLPRKQVVFTGDDYNFAPLIEGEDPAIERADELDGRPLPLGRFSHALLGVFDAIAEPASVALALLAQDDVARYRELMAPCEALGRHLFAPPVRHYKAGVAFLAWLNGLQDSYMLANHEQRARDVEHYLRAAELASAAGAIGDAALAAERLAELAGQSR